MGPRGGHATRRLDVQPASLPGVLPESRYRSADGLNRHNRLGFRGDDFPLAKPEGIYRVVCMGGSTVYDPLIPDYHLAFPAQLEVVLREQYGHGNVQVINAGVPGYTTWESSPNLQLRVLELDPDLVVIYHAVNDVTPRRVPPAQYFRDNSGYRRPWNQTRHLWDYPLFAHYLGVQWGISQRNALRDWVIWRERLNDDLNDVSFVDANSPVYFGENIENMVVLARHYGVDVLLTSWAQRAHREKPNATATPVYLQCIDEHNALSREVAERLDVPFYDFAAEMPTDGDYWADSHHNNEQGARKKAELFAAVIHDRFLTERP